MHDFVRDADSRTADGVASGAVVLAPLPHRASRPAGGGLPYSEFTQMLENERRQPSACPRPGAGIRAAAAVRRRPAPRFDFARPADPQLGTRRSRSANRRACAFPIRTASFRRTPCLRRNYRSPRIGDLRPLGQIHESFIIAAGRDGLWIIDQHVAHERILFEQVLKQRAAGRVEIAAAADAADPAAHRRSSRSNTRASPTNCTHPASRPSRSATAPSR